MKFHRLNLVRIFVGVYRSQGMTQASKELGISQPAISQHIKSFEAELGFTLFQRGGKQLIPTSKAHELFKLCERGINDVETGIEQLTEKNPALKGTINIGTPPEFCEAVLTSKIQAILKDSPLLSLRLREGSAIQLLHWLDEGLLDFAFSDSHLNEKNFHSTPVYQELVVLCISNSLLEQFPNVVNRKAYYEALPYIDYGDSCSFLRSWFAHHIGTRDLKLQIRASAMSCQLVAELIQSGVGAGVLPSEQVQRLMINGAKLFQFEGKRKPLVNQINLVYPKDRIQSASVKQLILTFENMFSLTPTQVFKAVG